MKNRNELKIFLADGLFVPAQMMVNGAVVQSFMLESGIAESKVSILVCMMQIVQVLIMILCSKAIDKLKYIIPLTAFSELAHIIMPLALFTYCQFPHIDSEKKFLCIFGVGFAVSIPQGIYSVLAYKLPYSVMNVERYGTVTAISGLVAGISGLVMSTGMSFSLGYGAYFEVMSLFFIGATIMIILAASLTFNMKMVNEVFETRSRKEKKINLFFYRPFYQLVLPHLLRGICSGVYTIMPTIGYYYGIIDSISTGYLIILTNIATFVSCYLYSFWARIKRINGKLILTSSVAICFCLPATLIANSTWIFLLMYFIGYFFVVIVNYATPTLITEIVDYKVMGQYSAWRMVLHTIGMGIASLICVPLLEVFGGIITLIIAGSFQLFAGIGYFMTERYRENKKQTI